MNYLVLMNRAAALERSAEIAIALGCGRSQEDITRYWFGVIEHTTLREGALEVTEDAKLTAPERALLKTEVALNALGWITRE